MNILNLITISLSPPFPDSGMVTAVVRLTGQDKVIIDTAADNMGMTKAVFMRVLLVKGAQKVLEELGIKIEHVQNEHVDMTRGETLIE